jgi:hypothetical protein
MFRPDATQVAKDWADRAVDFGPYTYAELFDRRSANYRGPIPKSPPAAGGACRCPSCASEGWYAQSPRCRLWRAFCELCHGTRTWLDRATLKRESCDICQAHWADDVRFFRDALRSPRAAARRLREEAAGRVASESAQ